ncbi:MAG: transcription-repair coupling factor [Gammaproteobacteria bacterium SG8_31]|nr:MAG: transcription-repair coupling factor [Gammaproteobacteria bacterium SG8_31]
MPASRHVLQIPPALPASPSGWGQLYGSAPSLAVAELAQLAAGPVLVVTPEPQAADRLRDEIAFFAGDNVEILLLPDSEALPYDAFSPHPDITSQRLRTLSRLPDITSGVVIVSLPTLMQRLPPAEWILGSSLDLTVGERLDGDAFRTRLVSGGYAAVSQVSQHGEFAIRGSIIDIFPMGSDRPFRVDLLDDEIESIRTFDVDSQRTIARQQRASVLPAREFPFTGDAVAAFRERFRQTFPIDLSRVSVYTDVAEGIAPGGIEFYLPLFFDRLDTLASYLPASCRIVVTTDMAPVADRVWTEVTARYEQLRHDLEQPRLPPETLYTRPDDVMELLHSRSGVRLEGFETDGAGWNAGTATLPPLRITGGPGHPADLLERFLGDFSGRVLFTAESPGRREMLKDMLRDRDLTVRPCESWQDFLASGQRLGLAIAPLEQGFRIASIGIAVVPESELLGERGRQRRRRRRQRDPEVLINQLTDLDLGAPVVHEEYGVGRFLGLESVTAGGTCGEFLALEYAGGDKLYVPVQALERITRYTGAAAESAPLHRLGSDQWARARQRAAKRVRDVAVELLDIYARRAARQGSQHRYPEADYRAFCEDFPFEETPDQAEAIDQVLSDLVAPRPMDRVVCGDVGFGKTEVALRAAFAAVQGGRQVAVLVPTTLLAQQHYQNFSDRFADWPVKIEALSRFRTGKQTERILAGLADGKVDIVIGTHRLLQKDVSFANLGLVVVDEEHRFGVRHKERLKALRAEVDVLTLTATPIPRTLNMAMGGLRDLSLITTPPSERLAVKTFVTEWKDERIREACLREIRRGGQIYFLHNRVETIENAARQIGELVPEARVRVAHGQMSERDLERIMLDFYHRRFNLLVCTTIIESGLDIPTANTIVIDRADRLGLAQLHQLRGRVGRSHHRAYAYLIVPHRKAMTRDAIKRLEAIESLEELGAGFMLATHDLEIRGAGELLGEDQSGQIHEVGFALYAEMLERAVRALKSGREPDLARPLHDGTEVEMGVTALLPEDFIPDVHTRLVLYKRIASAEDADTLRDLQVELIDRFGLLPEAAKMLFRATEVKLRASALAIQRIEAGPSGGHILFNAATPVEPAAIIRLVQEEGRRFKLDGQHKLRFSLELPDTEKRFHHVHTLLDQLGAPKLH